MSYQTLSCVLYYRSHKCHYETVLFETENNQDTYNANLHVVHHLNTLFNMTLQQLG